MQHYDIIIIGGGPGGYVAAIHAAHKGKKVCLIEKDNLGGVCLNRGCIPTKSMLKSVAVLETLHNSAHFGIVGLDPAGACISMPAMHKRTQGVVQKLVRGVGMLLEAAGVTLIQGFASFVAAKEVAVAGEHLSGENIIIATGSTPTQLAVPLNSTRVITSDEALTLPSPPAQMIIIGGGVIGIEFASIYASLGSRVTVIEFMDHILPMLDEPIGRQAEAALRKKGISLFTGARVSSIDDGTVTYVMDGTEHRHTADTILMAVGRTPCTQGLNLEIPGLVMDKKAIATDRHLRTNVPGIYAIGDVNGKSMLAHTASMEGLVAVNHICGGSDAMRYDRVPSCIYIHPEIACVGLTEQEATTRYGRVKVGEFPLAASGKAAVEGENTGLIRVIIEPEFGEILGAHCMAPHATDMIAEIALAMNAEATAQEIIATIHPHPTLSEIIPEAFHAALGRAIHSL